MKDFSILHADVDIHQNYLLEASAGTGKTFSIEHLAVRLLIEEPVCALEEILIVTFTKAATRDLKCRVRAALEGARRLLFDATAPEYLQVLIDKDEAKRRLERALFCFENAQIFTIHGFCQRMLSEFGFEAGVALSKDDEEKLPPLAFLRIIRDFFRTEVKLPNYHPVELKLLIKAHKNALENLERALLMLLSDGKKVAKQPSFTENFTRFLQVRREGIADAFTEVAPCFKGLCDRSKKVKAEVLRSVEALEKAQTEGDFAALIEDQLPWLDALHKDNLLKRAETTSEGILQRFSELKKALTPLISPLAIFSRMASDCQQLLMENVKEVECFCFDDLLHKMVRALEESSSFVAHVQKKYRVGIVDEFQDTDPIQWDIFQKLFLVDSKHLYLVGDPKQSIYAFRNADIYTYLSAAEMLGEEHRAHLTTNYRSDCHLVEALNALFQESNFITLPKLQKSLPYLPVKAGELTQQKPFSDALGSVHFMLCEGKGLAVMEEEFYFPFIADEIKKLKVKDQCSYSLMAVLVSDRFQANRLGAFLQSQKIPHALQRHQSLKDSPALLDLLTVLRGIVNPRKENALKKMLGSKMIGWTHTDIAALEREPVLEKAYALRSLLYERGFCHFFPALLQSSWLADGLTVATRLLEQEKGREFYREILQIGERVMDHESHTGVSPESICTFLEQFPLFDFNQEGMVKSFPCLGEDAVSILTMHASKGLEFDIVFALGVVKQTKSPPQLIANEDVLLPIFDTESETYRAFCQESDAEKMRQLYVAFTRAKHRLYVPVATSKKPPAPGCGSPQELFFAKFQRSVEAFCEENAHCTYTRKEAWKPVNLATNQEQESAMLCAPKYPPVAQHSKQFLSFTSLTKGSVCQAALQKTPPQEWSVEEKTVHTLPAGSATGTLLHRIFETLPLDQMHNLTPFIASSIKGTEAENWGAVIEEMIRQAFGEKIHTFSLADIDPKKCYREMEFLYPRGSDYLKGVIDFIFCHDGLYYIVDWKSNWLGPDASFYTKPHLEKAMQEHNYFLQAEIYKDALQRYLAVVDQRPFSTIFGGAAFVFLRGGVYFIDE